MTTAQVTTIRAAASTVPAGSCSIRAQAMIQELASGLDLTVAQIQSVWSQV